MKFNKNSINTKIWTYLVIFSLIILSFLWLFQVLFLPKYYEWQVTKNIKKLEKEIILNYQNKDTDTFYQLLENISFKNNICIELSNKTTNINYTEFFINRECIKSMQTKDLKTEFINSNQKHKMYTMINPQFNNKSLLYSLKLDNNLFIFISTSLVPINSTVKIIQSQYIFVTAIVLLLSLIISYFVSKKLAKPIETLTSSAKELAKGNYDTDFSTNTDIIEIDELASTLNHAKEELAKTDELRRDLMANVSHDLKTPLTMIKAYAEMVRDLTYKNKEKREANLNTIIEETDRLNNLVNDILSLSIMESKMLTLEKEKLNLTELIKQILKRYEIFSTTLEYQFILNTDKEIIINNADKQKLEQVIYNLINNAINYTGDDKKVYINIIDGKDITVEIKDTGKGINKDEINLIWDKYYKSKKNHQRNTVGTGLGLAIVKHILELHHYEYGVKSKKNEGTTFYFKIKKDK